MLFQILVCIAVIFSIKYLVSRRRLYKLASKFPGPKTLPVVGNLHYFLFKDGEAIFRGLDSMHKEFGKLFRLWKGQTLQIFTSDPSIAKLIWEDTQILDRRTIVKNLLSPLVGDGLITTSSYDKWKRIKKIILTNFHVKNLEGFVDSFAVESSILANLLEIVADNTITELYKNVKDRVLVSTFTTIMGTEMNSQYHDEYKKKWYSFDEVFELKMRKPWLCNKILFNLTKFAEQEVKSTEYIRNVFSDIIDRKTKEFQEGREGGENSQSMVDMMIRQSLLTKEEILDEVRTMYAASIETTTNACCFVLCLLGEHQKEQDKVYEEQANIFADDINRLLTTEDLKKMVYLEQVLHESMRLYPPVPLLRQHIPQDVLLDNGLTIPAGSFFALSIYTMQRNAEYFPEPERFIPERFSPNMIKNRHSHAYMPFGKGRTMCPGNNFAIMHIKAILSTVLRRLRVTETVGGMKTIDQTLTTNTNLKANAGYKVRLLPR